MSDMDPRPTDIQYLASLGVPLDDIADRAGVSPYAIQLELTTTTQEDPWTSE